jgi:hypothetical protein
MSATVDTISQLERANEARRRRAHLTDAAPSDIKTTEDLDLAAAVVDEKLHALTGADLKQRKKALAARREVLAKADTARLEAAREALATATARYEPARDRLVRLMDEFAEAKMDAVMARQAYESAWASLHNLAPEEAGMRLMPGSITSEQSHAYLGAINESRPW